MKCVDPEDLSMVWNDIFIIFELVLDYLLVNIRIIPVWIYKKYLPLNNWFLILLNLINCNE